MLVPGIGGAVLTPDPEAGGASLHFEVRGAGFYSGLTLAGEQSSPLSGPELFFSLSITIIHLKQFRERAPKEDLKCELIHSFIHSFHQYFKTLSERRLAITYSSERRKAFVQRGNWLEGESCGSGRRG